MMQLGGLDLRARTPCYPSPKALSHGSRRGRQGPGTAAQQTAELLTVTDVAEITRLSAGTLRYWRALEEGGPPSFRLGRRVMYRRADVEKRLDESR